MYLEQGTNELIRDFINRVNEAFLDTYGPNHKNSRFRRETKKQWLLEGIKPSIREELPDENDLPDTWPEITAAVQDAAWLVDLFYRKNHYFGRPARSYYGSDFNVENGRLVVYTDGACFRNGYPDAQAGIGVWFGRYSQMNVAEPLARRDPATNNVAEIKAVIKAFEIAKDNGFERVSIRTDSQYLIKSVTDWIFKWLSNGWHKADGTPLKHKNYYRQLLREMEGVDVEWVHVRGHSNDEGNEEADRLAREGAGQY